MPRAYCLGELLVLSMPRATATLRGGVSLCQPKLAALLAIHPLICSISVRRPSPHVLVHRGVVLCIGRRALVHEIDQFGQARLPSVPSKPMCYG